jgi:hypothetical protein
MNFTRKQHRRKQEVCLKPTFYGLPDRCHTLTVCDFYPGGVFISNPALKTLTDSNIIKMQYDNLRAHIKSKIGESKHYDAVPLMNHPQKKNTHTNITSLMKSIKQGSGKYRSILQRKVVHKDLHSPTNWRSKLNDHTITSNHIKQTRKNLQSRYLGSDTVDILSRLKMGKTLFRNQLQHIGTTETLHCPTCMRENNTEITEDLIHATFSCPYIHTIIDEITNTFFPYLQSNFTHRDTLLSIISNIHTLNEGKHL